VVSGNSDHLSTVGLREIAKDMYAASTEGKPGLQLTRSPARLSTAGVSTQHVMFVMEGLETSASPYGGL
jgi:hypothetical protein